jgi:hypothetical protein
MGSLDGSILRQWLLGSRPLRLLADALFRRRASKRLRALDGTPPGRVQARILRGLVHKAQNTRFGREHDFQRIRSEGDFRRLVPLARTAELWQQYGVGSLPALDGVTWPGPVPFLANCEVGGAVTPTPLPVSPDLVATHREALLAALAHVVAARPQARLLSGSLLLVGGGSALTPLSGSVGAYSLEEMVLAQLPRLLRPFTVVAPYSGDASLRSLAERATSLPVTCLVSNSARLRLLAAYMQWWTGRGRLLDLWPGLTAVLYSRGPADPDREQIARIVGTSTTRPPVLLLEGTVRPEGVLAIEDPRFGRQRVLADHGVYFEFAPADSVGDARPVRLGLGEVRPGVTYEVAVTSPAGLWAALVGLSVRFAQSEPALLETVEVRAAPVLSPAGLRAIRTDPPGRAAGLPPHSRTAGTPEGPARRSARSPWSARADQG